MFYDVLCLKSIFDFLLSERPSGVSPVIFVTSRHLVWDVIEVKENVKGGQIFHEVALCTFPDDDDDDWGGGGR